MRNLLARLVREDEGQDLIECALLAGLITTAVVATIRSSAPECWHSSLQLNTAIGG